VIDLQSWAVSHPMAAVGAVLVVLALLWLVLGGKRKTRERHRAPDALDEGAAPAQRNQALIDAPSAAASVVVAPVAEAVAEEVPVAEPVVAGDDLTQIKGLGPKLRTRLGELGVTSFAQIAAWSEADIVAIDAQLGSFAGRATRDQWVAQAGFLAAGDVAGYEAQFGKL
jgi:predicted flap endonuclease-1-like 5' DNA nuclease